MHRELRPKMIGTITELECASYLMKIGYAVSAPLGDTCPYDLIVDVNHQLYKIQCKTATIEESKIVIECTTNINTRTRLETHKYSAEDVDFFATYHEGRCYLIPFNEAQSTFSLRINFPKNNQTASIHWLEDYEASFIIDTSLKNINLTPPSKCRKKITTINSKMHYRWITDGTVDRRINLEETIPEGFSLGRCNSYHKP